MVKIELIKEFKKGSNIFLRGDVYSYEIEKDGDTVLCTCTQSYLPCVELEKKRYKNIQDCLNDLDIGNFFITFLNKK